MMLVFTRNQFWWWQKRYFCWNLVSRLCKEAYLRMYSHLIAPNSNICLPSVLFSGFRYLVLILAKTLLYGLTVLCGITLSSIHCLHFMSFTHVFRVEAFSAAAPYKVSSCKLRRQRLSEYFAFNKENIYIHRGRLNNKEETRFIWRKNMEQKS